MKNSQIDVSIVVVTFNNAAVIRRCLTTLSDAVESYSSELYIIDNNSVDGTVQILRNANTWKHLSFNHVEKIYNPSNVGYTRGLNQGLRKCRGRFVLMLNPDIIFTDNPFPKLFQCLRKENVAVVSPQFRFPNGDVQPSCRRFPAKRDVLFEFLGLSRILAASPFFNAWRMPDFDHRHSRDVPQPQGAFLLTRNSVLQAVGMPDEKLPMFFSDVDWCRRVIDSGRRIRFCAEAFVLHLQGASVRQKRAEMIVSSHRSFVAYFKKYDASVFDRMLTTTIHLLLLAATPLRLLATKLH